MYTIETTHTAPYAENLVNAINRRAASKIAHKANVKVKIKDFTRYFIVNDEIVGSVNTYPSNNGKFYATSKVGKVYGEHDYLFKSFASAITFALTACGITYEDVISAI